MIEMWKQVIQKTLAFGGVKLVRLPSKSQLQKMEETRQRSLQQEEKQKRWLTNLQIKTIFDVGANTGQFAHFITRIFPEAKIYSFEPLRECYEELVQSFDGNPNFQGFNLALSDEIGETKIYRNQYSPSSSLLPMGKLHKDTFPYTRRETVELIKVSRLDSIATDLEVNEPILIKIDVQGFENKVISGGINLISRAKLLVVEMSIEPLYDNQPLFNDIYQMLLNLGFWYCGNYDQLHHPDDGRILQVDSIFMKRECQ